MKVHAKNKPLANDVDLKEISKQTPGFVGADLENLLNEAALLAARRNKTQIDASDLDEAEDRVIAGPAKKDRVISPEERKTVAYHEAGHTIVGLVLNDARVVHKVTIVPRGRAGGYAIMLPREDQMWMSKKDAMEQIAGLMGGRTAEELIFHSESSGASNDFEQATQIARSMVTQYGMSDALGTVALESAGGQPFAGAGYPGQPSYSEHTASLIDTEVRRSSERPTRLLGRFWKNIKAEHKIIADALLKYETLDEKQILSLFNTGKMPESDNGNEFPSEKAATFEESKRELERREAERQASTEAKLASSASSDTESAAEPASSAASSAAPDDHDESDHSE